MILIALIGGCDDEAGRVAREAANRQAQQNTLMAELNKEVASGTHRLVEADSQARKEIIGVHHELQSERARLDAGRDDLEDERRRMAGDRRTESLLANLVPMFGGILLVTILLGFCWYVLAAGRHSQDQGSDLSELLLDEIILSDQPQLTTREQPRSLVGDTQPKN
jgi:hypothetical protein